MTRKNTRFVALKLLHLVRNLQLELASELLFGPRRFPSIASSARRQQVPDPVRTASFQRHTMVNGERDESLAVRADIPVRGHKGRPFVLCPEALCTNLAGSSPMGLGSVSIRVTPDPVALTLPIALAVSSRPFASSTSIGIVPDVPTTVSSKPTVSRAVLALRVRTQKLESTGDAAAYPGR